MWARVPTNVKATTVAFVLIGMLMVPIQLSGWSFPGFAALSSTVNFYRGLNLAEDGRLDEAVESFRRSFGLPLGTQTTLAAGPPVELNLLHRPHRAIGATWPHHSEPCDSMEALVVKKPKRTTDCL